MVIKDFKSRWLVDEKYSQVVFYVLIKYFDASMSAFEHFVTQKYVYVSI